MSNMEDRGYVRMSRTVANYAFYTAEEIDDAWVNLYWLADVIRHYDAGSAKLTDPAGQNEFQREQNERAQLEILRPAVEGANADRESRGL